MAKISVLGLGAMGSRMALNFGAAGHAVTVWNRTGAVAESLAAAHGFTAAETPRDAAFGADFVVSMVADDDAAHDVWLAPDTGALNSIAPEGVGIESSTISPEAAKALGVQARAAGRLFVEAPVVGSRPQVESGTLFCLVGGENRAVEVAQPVLEINAGAIRHVGEIGTAATMKLAINGLFGIQVAAYAEIVGLLDRSEVDSGVALEILENLPITSPGLQRILGLFAARDFAPNFPIRLVAKDFGYLDAVASDLGADHPITAATAALFTSAAGCGDADLDIAGLAGRYL